MPRVGVGLLSCLGVLLAVIQHALEIKAEVVGQRSEHAAGRVRVVIVAAARMVNAFLAAAMGNAFEQSKFFQQACMIWQPDEFLW